MNQEWSYNKTHSLHSVWSLIWLKQSNLYFLFIDLETKWSFVVSIQSTIHPFCPFFVSRFTPEILLQLQNGVQTLIACSYYCNYFTDNKKLVENYKWNKVQYIAERFIMRSCNLQKNQTDSFNCISQKYVLSYEK